MTRSLWLLIATVVFAVTFVFFGRMWFMENYHPVQYTRWQGLQGKAEYDEFYIAENFLRRKGVTVVRKKNYNRLERDNIDKFNTIFLSNTGSTLSRLQIKLLLMWVERGNKLIVEGKVPDYIVSYQTVDNSMHSYNVNARNLLGIAGIGVSVYAKDKCAPITQQFYNAKTDAKVLFDKTLVDASVDDLLAINRKRYTVSFKANNEILLLNQRRYFQYNAVAYRDTKIEGKKGHCQEELYATFAYGKGTIVTYTQHPDIFSSSPRWGRHDSIFSYHNATYLYWLLNLQGDPGKVLWYETDIYPSVWTVLWEHWHFAVIFGVLLVVAWVWFHAYRFGSLISEDERKVLSMNRHISATGEFYYNSGNKNVLVDSCYAQLNQHIERYIPMAQYMSKVLLSEKIAAMTGVPLPHVERVLTYEYPVDDVEFVQLIRVINEIRKLLCNQKKTNSPPVNQ